jgi:chemotaxis protein methyltransferase WspC
MFQHQIEALIKQRSGIDVAIVGTGLIKNAVVRQMQLREIPDLALYWALLQRDQQAVQQLIEMVVVPETWFFRDRAPFQFLVKQVQEILAKRLLNSPLRILSVPCSTGEEPYSIAIALLQAGIPPAKFQIDAIDISQKNINQAKQGIYSRFSFRNDDEALQAEFFNQVDKTFHLQQRIKQLVQFRVANLLEAEHWGRSQSYDLIFCRNLLIYFDQATRQQVFAQIDRLLKPMGTLFVGHAESSLLLNAGWQGVRVPFTFAYRKPNPRPHPKPTPQPFPPSPPPRTVPKHNVPKHLLQVNLLQVNASIPPVPMLKEPQDYLQTARELADRGELAEAEQLCLQQLQTSPLQPEIYLLLGQIYQAQKQEMMAETYFRKVLYLQANSIEALTHLARLKQQQGHIAMANRFYQRIDRLRGYRSV